MSRSTTFDRRDVSHLGRWVPTGGDGASMAGLINAVFFLGLTRLLRTWPS